MNKKDTGYYIKRISDYVEADANSELEQYGITCSQARVLSFLLRRRDKVTILKDIEDFFEIKHPTVIGIIQRMEAKGFVESSVDPDDKRQRIIKVTSSAIELEKKLNKHSLEAEKRMVDGLTPDEVNEFKRLLYAVYKNIGKWGSVKYVSSFYSLESFAGQLA